MSIARPSRFPCLAACILPLLLAAATAATAEQETDPGLKYLGRYTHQALDGRHVLGVEHVFGHYAFVSTNRTLCLVDLDSLGTNADDACVASIPGVDSTTTVTREDGYVYVNLRRGGILVAHLDQPSMTLTPLREISEQGVYFEKMTLTEDRLYVAAHAFGIRIYDLADPADPALRSALQTGFVDAWAVDVEGDRAYVADGAGGLKVVDVTDDTAPNILAGENPSSAPGTAMDVRVVAGQAYVASGGAGVAVYDTADPAGRRVYPTSVSAEQLAVLDGHLAVVDTTGFLVFRIESDGGLTVIAREESKYRWADDKMILRLWHGIDAWGPDRILAANWNSLDAYELGISELPAAQPDIAATAQRIRFPVTGGTTTLEILSGGSSTLELEDLAGPEQPFFAQLSDSVALEPGDSAELDISYAGQTPAADVVRVGSSDPDEAPLPIQIFGETEYLDPGEPAVPFTLEAWELNHETGEFTYSPFELAAMTDKVVYFYIFSSGCPDCMTAVADTQNTILKRFEHDPRVEVAVMSQAEPRSILETYWRNLYLRGRMLYDPTGAVADAAYGQPEASACTGACSTLLPASRAFIIGADQQVVLPIFGHDPGRVIATISELLRDIPLHGDLNGSGAVGSGDADWMSICFTGTGVGPLRPGCEASDFDGDGDVDCDDWRALTLAWTTPDEPPQLPECAPESPAVSLRLQTTDIGTRLLWVGDGDATYDVVRGRLSAIHESRFVTLLGSVDCLEAAASDGDSLDAGRAGDAAPGDAVFYLLLRHDRPRRVVESVGAAHPRLPSGEDCVAWTQPRP